MQVNFKPGNWRAFYEAFFGRLPQPNADDWINVDCPLPTHPDGKPRSGKGAINCQSGNFMCLNLNCMAEYQTVRRSTSKVLSPREFLVLAKGLSEDRATELYDEWRRVDVQTTHHDEFLPAPSPTRETMAFCELAHSMLSPDLPIVQEYCKSRGLKYETLVQAKIGFVPQSDGQEECLIFPYYVNGEVWAIRARTFDGRKGGAAKSFRTLYLLDELKTRKAPCAVIVEGETDTLFTRQALDTAGLTTVPVVGTPGADFRAEWARHFQGRRRIVAIRQDDEAGGLWAAKVSRELPHAVIVRLRWPIGSIGNDVSDYGRLVGFEKLLDHLSISPSDLEPVEEGFLTLSRFATKWRNKAPEWVIPELVERSTKTLVIGDPKVGKTWIALQMIRSVLNSQPFMGETLWTPTFQGRVMLIEEEGSPFRLWQRFDTLGLEDSDKLLIAHRQRIRLDESGGVAELCEQASRFRPDLLLLDPYASLHGQDENTVQGTNIVLDGINRVLYAVPTVAVVLIHHRPKGGQGARGSGALWGAFDTQIEVETSMTDETIKVEIRGRDLPDEWHGGKSFVFNGELGEHVALEQKTSDSLHSKMALSKLQREILDWLRRMGGWRTVDDLATPLQRNAEYIRATLKQLEHLKIVEAAIGPPKTYRAVELPKISENGA